MKVVIDANRLIAALIKEGTTRLILFDNLFEFIAPDFIFNEIKKYEKEIIKKANITKEQFDILIALISENIMIIAVEEYEDIILELNVKDKNDIAYLAVAIKSNAYGIWTHDSGFLEVKEIKILTNIDMLKLISK